MTPKALITTVPFGTDPRSLTGLRDAGVEYVLNPLGRRPTEAEMCDLVRDIDLLIAGTEPITGRVIAAAPRLRIISRVGVGVDNVDLSAARHRGIVVAYTPDGPAPAVAELTVGLMLSLLRSIHTANARVRTDGWYRFMGSRLAEVTVGIVGVGRIGRRVIGLLAGFRPTILANDLQPSRDVPGVQWVEKDELYERADVISVHLPLTPATVDMITARQIERMKPGAVLINTARGGIVNEADLAAALRRGRLAGAAVDVFTDEPYQGELLGVDRCLITCHMGSMSIDCRARMELEATENVVHYLRTGRPVQAVADSEYEVQEARPA